MYGSFYVSFLPPPSSSCAPILIPQWTLALGPAAGLTLIGSSACNTFLTYPGAGTPSLALRSQLTSRSTPSSSWILMPVGQSTPITAGTWNIVESSSGMYLTAWDQDPAVMSSGSPLTLERENSNDTRQQFWFQVVTDGYIVPTAVCFEPVGVPHWREVCHRRGRELFTVGMQAHELCWTDVASPPRNEIVQSFLENTVREYGPKSVLYISFGSLFFPIATPQLIDALVNTLLALEEPFPFIFALGGNSPLCPENSLSAAACDPHTRWRWLVPYTRRLQLRVRVAVPGNPTHRLAACVEQPVNAAFLAAEPNPVAIELLQVRVGPHLAPSLRGGPKITGTVEDATQEFRAAFDAARGSKGAVLRANAMKMAQALRGARAGEASEEIIRLANFNLPVVA
ncbi:hypothetical protein C8R44DRAFT_991438 [Mycena epipterygia]|nr:hypothetical protein C8R44DRAFT_991438 [Mycena epipterygia]